MGCIHSEPERLDPRALGNPADVPCPRCGVQNYIEPKRREVPCFKCGNIVSRFQRTANGLVNSHMERIKSDQRTAQFIEAVK